MLLHKASFCKINNHIILDVIVKYGFIKRLFKKVDGECIRYFGPGTVWREYNTGKRPGTLIESELSDIAAIWSLKNVTK